MKLVFHRNTDTGSSNSIALCSRSISFYFHCLGRRRHGILCRKGDYFLFRCLETFPTFSILRSPLCVLFRIKSPSCHFGLCSRGLRDFRCSHRLISFFYPYFCFHPSPLSSIKLTVPLFPHTIDTRSSQRILYAKSRRNRPQPAGFGDYRFHQTVQSPSRRRW